jgi:hypothetical protein
MTTHKLLSTKDLDLMLNAAGPDIKRRVLTHIAALEADNAALVKAARGPLRLLAEPVVREVALRGLIEDMGVVVNQPHPGHALLEEHRRALAQYEDVLMRAGEALGLQSVTLPSLLGAIRKALAEKDAEIARHLRSINTLVGDDYKRTLARARNEGLEMAAERLREEAHEMEARYADRRNRGGESEPSTMVVIGTLRGMADNIARTLKEPEE